MASNETADTVNVNRAYQNAWIVYINGLEVPVSSVSVSYGVWQIPQAEIVMVPDPVLQRLGAEDRVAVQVFYCDQWINTNKPEFRLLFDGEIIGWSYVNVNRQRSISYTAVDYIQIFTQLFFFFMSGIDDMAIGAGADTIGANINGVNMAGMGVLFPYSLFTEGLFPPAGTDDARAPAPLIKRPIDYVYNLVRGMVYNVPRRSVPMANFFAPWARKTKFDRRFVALPYLEQDPEHPDSPSIFPILRSVQANFAVAAVQKLTSNLGSAGSVWQVFEQVLSTLMMELAMIPTPVAIQCTDNLEAKGLASGKHTGKHPIHLGNYFVKPQFLFGLPPACNVFFPSQITSFAYQENYATQPTRMYFSEDSWLTYINQKTASPGLESVIRNALSVAHPEEVNLAMRDSLQHPGHNGKNTLVYPEEFFRGPVVDRRTMPRWFTFLSESQLEEIGDLSSIKDRNELLKSAQDVLPGDKERNLYRKYAAYEFSKEKYARRNGALNMPFNPYPVPGFPCAVFDHRYTQLDVFGYIMNVRHTLSSRSATTDVTISYGRTIKEAFNLLSKQIATENAVLNRDHANVNNALKDTNTNVTSDVIQNMERVGAIAVAPAEPIREIRDVIQNFVRAENFYRALFYGFVDPAASKDASSSTQTDANRSDPAENSQNQSSAEKNQSTPDDAPAPDINYSTPDQAGVANANMSSPDGNVLIVSDEPVSPWSAGSDVKKTASFQYHQIIQFLNAQGTKEQINLIGMDGTTRIALVKIIDKMRVGTATATEIAELEKALDRPIAPANVDLTTSNPELLIQLNYAEEQIQNYLTDSNIRGIGIDLIPTPAAASLFVNYDEAMKYNSRPICTLDNYIAFLGADASPDGRRGPVNALATDDTRVFPAGFYTYIRKYRAGPPETLPNLNLTNASVLTSPDGLYVIPLGAENVNLEEFVQSIDKAQNVTSGKGSVPTIPEVHSIPDDFPETTEDWDSVLRTYRTNTLSRLAPSR